MTKLVQNDLASLTNEQSALAALNSNYASLEAFSDLVLSRDGRSPNEMLADLDMNSNRILNLPVPVAGGDPLRLQDLSTFIGGGSIVAGAPTNASYITLGTNPTLTNERVLTAGTGISLADGGAGGAATVSIASGVIRTLLTANQTYFIRTDGNDSNNGLSNSAGGAWLTLQHAYDFIAANIDCGGFQATVQVGNGTYAGLTVFSPIVGGPAAALSGLKFLGDTTTPSNVVISGSGACVTCTGAGVTVIMSGFKFTSSGSNCLYASGGGLIAIQGKVDFGSAAQNHMFANVNGIILVQISAYNITAGAQCHYRADKSGTIEVIATSVTLTGTPAFSIAFAAAVFGYTIHGGCTFTGSATGSRYIVLLNGVVDSGSGGANYFPGNAAGSTATGGQYV